MSNSIERLYPVASSDDRNIWACLLTNEGYLRGVLTLYYSLLKSGTKYPFYVIYTDVRRLRSSNWLNLDTRTTGA
jgi:hypothetical protein